MPLSLYMDVNVQLDITIALQKRDLDIITAQEDGCRRLSDEKLLRRATQLKRVLFTQDADFLREATICQKSGTTFSGVIYAHQEHASIGQCVEDLELISKVLSLDEVINKILWIPI